MTRRMLDMWTSLHGFIAGAHLSQEQPLGEGGDRLHECAVTVRSFGARDGMAAGEVNEDYRIVAETIDAAGAFAGSAPDGSDHAVPLPIPPFPTRPGSLRCSNKP